MKPSKCNETEFSIAKLGTADVSPTVPKHIIEHIDQCDTCTKEYAHLRSALLDACTVKLPDISSSFWDAFPNNVLAQVNDIKADIQTVDQTNNVTELAAYRSDTLASKSNLETLPRQQNTTKNRAHYRVYGSIAACFVVVVAVIWLFPKSGASYQHQTYAYQSGLDHHASFAAIIEQIEAKLAPAAVLSFGPQIQSINGFHVGSYYAESLALIDVAQQNASRDRLQSLLTKVASDENETYLKNVLEKTLVVFSGADVTRRDKINAIEAFAGNYSRYLTKNDSSELVYFRFGTWTVDMALAASSHSADSLRNQTTQLDYFIHAFSALSAPLGVINGLKELRVLIDQPINADIDTQRIFRINQELRQLLI